MTCAVSAAVREGAEAVVCASTGNTAASAAAYAARAGLRCAVIVPEGKIATGKLAQALMHGARVIALRGNFDEALALVRELAAAPSDRAGQLGQRVPDRGPEDGRVRDRRGARRGARRALHPGRQRRQHHRLLARASASSAATPRMLGFQAAGAAPLVHGAPVEHPETVASAIRIGNPARWEDAMNAMTASGGAVRAVTDEQILAAYRFLAATEGIFCEPASAASVAGLLAHGAGDARRVACVLTGHGLKDPDGAGAGWRGGPLRAGARRARARGPRVTLARRRLVRVPASTANLGPGFDVLAAALALHLELEVVETGAFAVHTELDVPRDRTNLVVRAFERLHPADGFEFRIASEIPLTGGLGSSAAAIVAGLLAADHLFELDADVFGHAVELEGHPDNVAAALEGGFVICDGARVHRFEPPMGLEAVLVVPAEAVATAEARAALPEAVPLADAVFNVAHAAMLTLGLAQRRLGSDRRGPATTGCTSRTGPACTRARPSCSSGPRTLGALGATISGAGPTVLVWCQYEQTGAIVETLDARDARAGRRWCGRPFESQGADVREL